MPSTFLLHQKLKYRKTVWSLGHLHLWEQVWVHKSRLIHIQRCILSKFGTINLLKSTFFFFFMVSAFVSYISTLLPNPKIQRFILCCLIFHMVAVIFCLWFILGIFVKCLVWSIWLSNCSNTFLLMRLSFLYLETLASLLKVSRLYIYGPATGSIALCQGSTNVAQRPNLSYSLFCKLSFARNSVKLIYFLNSIYNYFHATKAD